MSVPEERYTNQTNTVCVTEDDCNSSSYGDEDYSADSELELGDLNCTDDDLSHSSLEFNQGRLSSSPTASGRRNTNLNTRDIPDNALRQHVVINNDIVDEGLRLYMMFLQQEIIGSRLEPPGFIWRQNREMPRNIGTLRALADQFSTSAQRQWIRQQAQVVPLQSLDFCSFIELLGGLFQEGGVTWERILVLFYFCTDISIRALEEKLFLLFQGIQDWVQFYIERRVCRWVQQNGGWEVILQQSLNQVTKIAILGFCCVGIIALCVYIRNNSVK